MKFLRETVWFTLTKKIGFILAFPLLGSLISIVFFVHFLEETRFDSHFMNVAGRQRMLSSELFSWSHMVAMGQEEDRVGLQARIEEFEKSLSALRQGGDILGGRLASAPWEIQDALTLTDEFWRKLKPDLITVAAKPRTDPHFRVAYQRVEKGVNELGALSHQVTARYDQRTQRLRSRLFYILIGAVCLSCIALFVAVFFARRYIVNPILRTGEAARRIEGGDFMQRLVVSSRDEFSVLAIAFNQMTDRVEQLLSELTRLASSDVLTGLPNRSLLLDRLAQALKYAARCKRMVAVLFFDLDRFREINDNFGHNVGDLLLKALTARLVGCIRASDTVGRLGGDEFVVILGDILRMQDVVIVARKILDNLAEPFQIDIPEAGQKTFFVTTSIGISLYPRDGDESSVLIKNADTAMYRAKEQGRNRYQFFAMEMNARVNDRVRMENVLHTALQQDQFVVHYQPQVDLATNRVVGVEALLRWNHPDRALLLPIEFIPLLEETGLIIEVGSWVLRTALAQLEKWDNEQLSLLRMTVNVSVHQLRHAHFVETVRQVLSNSRITPDRLELEISESVLMQDIEKIAKTLRALHDLGVRLSVDDFGIGYSSFNYLRIFPPIDVIKIDQTFVRDCLSNGSSAAIVRTIIVLAHTLGIHVIAVGIEQKEQCTFLRAHHCDTGQGYFFSRPDQAERLSPLLKKY